MKTKKISLLLLIFFVITFSIFAQNPISDFEYDIDGHGKISITKYIGRSSNVVIPREIGGFPVTQIGVSAFRENHMIIRVTIPEGINKIDLSAFLNCINLNEINLPNSLTSIGNFAFYGCKNLRRIFLPESVINFGVGVFQNTGLTNIILPSGIKTISSWMFKGTLIEQIVIPEGVTHIGGEAFADCVNLRMISLPSTIKSIGHPVMFNEINSLSNYLQGGGEDGPYEELSNKNAGGVFKNCRMLSNITIPANVNQIEFIRYYSVWDIFISCDDIFEGCTNIPLSSQQRLRQLGYTGVFR